MRIEGVCYLPLVRGLYRQLEGRVPRKDILKDEDTVDASRVLKLFEYGYCDVENEEPTSCVCGHDIKNLFYVYCKAMDDHVVVGSCCIERWLDKKLAAAAQRYLKHKTKLCNFKRHPEVHCAWCGKRAASLEGKLVHKACRWACYENLLEVAKQTPFIESMKARRKTNPGFVSEKQWVALTDSRWWSSERRLDLFRKSPHCFLGQLPP